MALKISLKPGEKIVVNGAVICNCERRTSLLIQNRAAILRERDLMQESDANTTIKRVYFAVMSSCLDPDNANDHDEAFTEYMMNLMEEMREAEALSLCAAISSDVMNQRYYQALVNCRKLLAIDDKEFSAKGDEGVRPMD
ncbi:MAG: flagellar biosynthesis repressor FlbT [Sphingomonadales bacterium]|jgi:flagellar protein FlbT